MREGQRTLRLNFEFIWTKTLFAHRGGFYVPTVIDRYSRPEMSKIWSDQRKFEIWLEIEVLACEAMAELCQIPKEDAVEIRKRARFSIPKIFEIEKRTNHDVIAFLENVAESVGPASRWIHQGLTSSDILDTTLAVQLNESCQILLEDLEALRIAIAHQARRYKMTPMIGRSHGVHAEPITFGLSWRSCMRNSVALWIAWRKPESVFASARSVAQWARMRISIRRSS